jgi:hypothetical protein
LHLLERDAFDMGERLTLGRVLHYGEGGSRDLDQLHPLTEPAHRLPVDAVAVEDHHDPRPLDRRH